MPKSLIQRVQELRPKRIMVIGDLILDKYTIGTASRLSPEAPVPVLEVKERTYNLGGAGNTAANIHAMKSVPYLIGIVGEDENGELICSLAARLGTHSIYKFPGCRTIKKERVVANGQQVVRIDENDKIPFSREYANFIWTTFLTRSEDADVVVISDYAKGTLSEDLIKDIIKDCNQRHIPIIIDPRPEHVDAYRNATYITPNLAEAHEMCSQIIPSFDAPKTPPNACDIAVGLKERLNTSVVLTLAEHGIYFAPRDKSRHEMYLDSHRYHFKTHPRQVRDVSGAGDTVVAMLAVGLANNLTPEQAIILANHAASVKVQKHQVQPVSLDEVIADLREN